MPGKAGNLFYTDGSIGGHDYQGPQQYGGSSLMRSTDGGATWAAVPGVSKVLAIGFGAPRPGTSTATIYLSGTVGTTYGIWRSTDDAASWTMIADYPYVIDWVTTISGDADTFGLVYIGFLGSSFVHGKPGKSTEAGPTVSFP